MMGSENVNALEASCSVLYLIAKSRAAEVTGNTLIEPTVRVMEKVIVEMRQAN
jgi:hypothetical protein